MSTNRVPITFRIFAGDRFIREETLDQPVIKLGKLSSSHVRLDDETVSRMHAVIELTAGVASIIDLGSGSGTLVNGQRVNKAELRSGDTISLGATRIEIALASPAAVTAPVHATAVEIPVSPPPPPLPRAVMPPAPIAAMGAAQPFAPMAPFAMTSIDDGGGARAVEVAAMLGDSVVGVKHVMDPRGGKVTPLTYGLFATGAVVLIAAAASFYVAVDNAQFNQREKEVWTAQLDKPAHEFRPRKISLGYDWVAFGGLFAGLAAFTIGMLRVRSEREEPFFRIGTAAEAEFACDAAPSPAFPLVAPLGDEFVLNIAAGMGGEMTVDGTSTQLSELASSGRARPSTSTPGATEVPIPANARIRVNAGINTFLVSSVARPKRQAVPVFAYSSAFMAFFAASAMVHLGFWALLNTIPPDPHSLTGDLGSNEARLTRTKSKTNEDPKTPEELEREKSDDEAGGTGTAMVMDDGKMGTKNSDRESGRYKMKQTQEKEQLSRTEAAEEARSAGFLGDLKAQQGGAFASLTGTGDISSGFDDANIYGGLLGDEYGEMSGGFGYGRSGFGPGGNGTGWGTIGTGRYGTIGQGDGTGIGFTTGGGRGLRGTREAKVPDPEIGRATPSGGDLDANIIRRYIRQKLPRIKYCYEKELLVKPGLAGTVNTQFQISPQGKVLNASASGVNGTVAACVADVIRSISFPKPKDGGLVQVSRYPFTFRQR